MQKNHEGVKFGKIFNPLEAITLPQPQEVVNRPVAAEIKAANMLKSQPLRSPTLASGTDLQKTNQEKNQIKIDPKKNFFTFSLGTFIRGKWSPTKWLKGEEPCSSWNFCFEALEGTNITATFTDQYIKRGNISFDVDYSSMLGYRISSKDWRLNPIPKTRGFQFSIAAIPTLRIAKLGNSIPIGMSIGVGPALHLGNRVVDSEDFSPVLSRVNYEITIPLDQEQNTTIVTSITHDCTFLGMLKNSNGSRFGHQWYTVGIRKKL